MKKRVFILAAVTAAAAVLIITAEHKKSVTDSESPEAPPAANVTERMDYFALHGWEVEEVAAKDIVIPEEFSSAYEEYVRMQDKQGLQLRKYVGRNAKLYVYDIKNYSPDSRKMLAELLVCDDIAVASMVYSEDGGSLRMPVS